MVISTRYDKVQSGGSVLHRMLIIFAAVMQN